MQDNILLETCMFITLIKKIETLNIAIADKLQGNFLINACTCIFDNNFDANSQTFQVYVFLRLW